MSDIVVRHNGYNVLNTGSHAELCNLQDIIEKKNIDLLLFYLCERQCCMATVKDNLAKTASQVKDIVSLANKLNIEVVFGGSGIPGMGGKEAPTRVQQNMNPLSIDDIYGRYPWMISMNNLL